jgi:peptide-methionine (S)-S-oxide reductase
VAAETAVFAMGCFWCGEEAMEAIPGVSKVESGYSGGTTVNPTYRQVSAGVTGHLEVVRVHFDPKKVSYTKILYYFWRNVDPLDSRG